MFYGIPISPTLKNFYAWSPSDLSTIPEWVDGVFLNAHKENYVVYTKEPMKKFLVSPDEILVYCGIGSVVFFLVLKKEMMQNWWKINEELIPQFEEHRPIGDITYIEYANKNFF